MTKKILVLDWSAIGKSMAQSVNSRKVPWTNSSFDEELAMRICEFTYSLWRQHQPDVTIIAQDSKPYWRAKFIHDWYLTHAQFYRHSSDTYVLMDGDLRRCEFEWDEAGTKRVELHKITAKLKAEYACYCGAANCRGTMLAPKRGWKPPMPHGTP